MATSTQTDRQRTEWCDGEGNKIDLETNGNQGGDLDQDESMAFPGRGQTVGHQKPRDYETDEDFHDVDQHVHADRERLLHRLQNPRWNPPHLLPLPHEELHWTPFTYLGELEDWELVKSLRRSETDDGKRLTDKELTWAVRAMRRAEKYMQCKSFPQAILLLERIAAKLPSATLAYFKLALCYMAHGDERQLSFAYVLFRWATYLEPMNRHLQTHVQHMQRMLRKEPISDEYFLSEETPLATGDIVALLEYVKHASIS